MFIIQVMISDVNPNDFQTALLYDCFCLRIKKRHIAMPFLVDQNFATYFVIVNVRVIGAA